MILPSRRHILPLFLLAALLLQACAPPLVTEPAPAAEPLKVKVLLLPFMGFSPMFVAQEEGYFAEQGLDVEFVQFNRTIEATPALVQGDIDVAIVAVNAGILNAIAQAGTVKFVAGVSRHPTDAACSYGGLLARRELMESGALATSAGLKGLRIAMDPTGPEGYYMKKLLDEAGLTLDDMEIVSIPTAAEGEALQNSAIDLLATSEPWVTRALQSPDIVLWKGVQMIRPEFQLSVLAYSSPLLRENREAGQRFMVAYLKAVQQFNQGKTERNLGILMQYTDLDRELLEAVCWSPIPTEADINLEGVLDFQQWALEEGLLDRVVPQEELWDASFLEYGRQALSLAAP